MVIFGKTIKKVFGKKTGKLEKRWVFDAKSSVLAPPLVTTLSNGNKAIFFGTQSGIIFLLDENAKLVWSQKVQDKTSEIQELFSDSGFSNSINVKPSIIDRGAGKFNLIVGTDTGVVHSFDEKGRKLWRFETNGEVRTTPLIHDIDGDGEMEIIFGSNDGNLYVLNGKGNLVWSYKASSGIEGDPAIFMDKEKRLQIVFGSNDGTIYSISQTGELHWTYKTDSQIQAAPIFSDLDGKGEMSIVLGSLDKNLYTLSENGALLWKFQTEGGIYSSVCIIDMNRDNKNEILFGSCDDKVYALNNKGEQLWNYETDFWVMSSPIVVDIDNDKKLEVVAGSYDKSLYVLDAEGHYHLDYVPGVGGVMNQPGHYSDDMVKEPGKYVGKKIWEHKADGMVIGIGFIEDINNAIRIVVCTKNGKINIFRHMSE